MRGIITEKTLNPLDLSLAIPHPLFMQSYSSVAAARAALVSKGRALHFLPITGRKPVKLIANEAILATFDDKVFEQAANAAEAPGVHQLIVCPDSHSGYGAPVGSTMVTRGMLYPGMVGPDIACSMSYLQLDVPDEAISDKATRRALINAILDRVPTGAHSRQAPKARHLNPETYEDAAIYGAHPAGPLAKLGIPTHWADRLESVSRGDIGVLARRLREHHDARIRAKTLQLGSLGAGNHFSECQSATVSPGMEDIASRFGIQSGRVGFLSHCGSRGFGFQLAAGHFRGLESHFKRWGIPLPAGEKELVHAPVDSPEGQAYLADMYLGANFAVVNHLLINSYVLEAFQEVLPGTKGDLVYHISHNIGHEEIVDGSKAWVFRKGATRAYPAGHHALRGTRYQDTGHPILLPGNPEGGSRIMVGLSGAEVTAYSINHGAGRAMGRNDAKRRLNQQTVDASMETADILFNGRSYPVDEASAAYKDFGQVCASVEEAGLAKTVATLKARFVIKDMDQSAEGKA